MIFVLLVRAQGALIAKQYNNRHQCLVSVVFTFTPLVDIMEQASRLGGQRGNAATPLLFGR